MSEAGLLYFKLDGATPEESERCRVIIHTLFQAGILSLRNGSATLHFDSDGVLQQIKTERIAFKRTPNRN